MISKPKSDGGSVYHFYNKSARDARENYIAGKPSLSAHLILHSLLNVASRCVENLRERAQYMHYFRRSFKDICKVLKDKPAIIETRPELYEIYQVFMNYPEPTKENCKEISGNILNILKNYPP